MVHSSLLSRLGVIRKLVESALLEVSNAHAREWIMAKAALLLGTLGADLAVLGVATSTPQNNSTVTGITWWSSNDNSGG